MIRSLQQRLFRVALLEVGLSLAALTSCHVRYRYDIPTQMIQSPGTQLWAVGLQKSDGGYRVSAVTRLNGPNPLLEQPTVVIALGSTANWQWEVRAVPSLLPSWKAWQDDKKVQQRVQHPDEWGHPAANWEQAFARAHKVTSYLLGRPPLPLKATLLLIPNGSAYEKTFVQTGTGFVPLTFAFYYPSGTSETSALAGERFSALVDAVSRTIYEYQHVLVHAEDIKPLGRNEADKTINDETRSHCWYHSTLLALTSGTHTELKWDPSAARQALFEKSTEQNILMEGEDKAGDPRALPPQRRYSEAILWARYLETNALATYLRERGKRDPKVLSNDPAAMNAVLSVCRAMTQVPRDLTAGPYPVSKVEYVPFFPAQLGMGTKPEDTK